MKEWGEDIIYYNKWEPAINKAPLYYSDSKERAMREVSKRIVGERPVISGPPPVHHPPMENSVESCYTLFFEID